MILKFCFIISILCPFLPESYKKIETEHFHKEIDSIFAWHKNNLESYTKYILSHAKNQLDIIKELKNENSKLLTYQELKNKIVKFLNDTIVFTNELEIKKIIESTVTGVLLKYTTNIQEAVIFETKLKDELVRSFFLAKSNFIDVLVDTFLKHLDSKSLNKELSYITTLQAESCIGFHEVLLEIINRPLRLKNFALTNPLHECMPLGSPRNKKASYLNLKLRKVAKYDLQLYGNKLTNKLYQQNSSFLNDVFKFEKMIDIAKQLLLNSIDNKNNEESKNNEDNKKDENSLLKFMETKIFISIEFSNIFANILLSNAFHIYSQKFKEDCKDLEKSINKLKENVNRAYLEYKKKVIKYNAQKKETLKDEITNMFLSFKLSLKDLSIKYDISGVWFIDQFTDKLDRSEELYKDIEQKKLICQTKNDEMNRMDIIEFDTVLYRILVTDHKFYVKLVQFDNFFAESTIPVNIEVKIQEYNSVEVKIPKPQRIINLLGQITSYFKYFGFELDAIIKISKKVQEEIDEIEVKFNSIKILIKKNLASVPEEVLQDLFELYNKYSELLKEINMFIFTKAKNFQDHKVLHTEIEENFKRIDTLQNGFKNINKTKVLQPSTDSFGSNNKNEPTDLNNKNEPTDLNNKNEPTDLHNKNSSVQKIILLTVTIVFLLGLSCFIVLKFLKLKK